MNGMAAAGERETLIEYGGISEPWKIGSSECGKRRCERVVTHTLKRSICLKEQADATGSIAQPTRARSTTALPTARHVDIQEGGYPQAWIFNRAVIWYPPRTTWG
jgi:hypothetical protein